MSIHPRQSSWFDQAGFTCCASQARAFLSPGVDLRVAHGILFQVDRCVHVAVVRGLARRDVNAAINLKQNTVGYTGINAWGQEGSGLAGTASETGLVEPGTLPWVNTHFHSRER